MRRTMIFLQTSSALCIFLLAQSPSIMSAQVPQPVNPLPPPVDTGQPIALMPAGELDNLVAPIALYPDPLLSQVLVASTYPLEVVEAYQWLQRNPGLTGPALTQAAGQQNWDPSIQALVMFPNVLSQLNQDIAWTTNLGNAYLAQSQDVMNSVQRLRLQAQQAGQLVSTPQQTVVTTAEAGQPVVVIEPAYPDVIYVPVYDPAWFWGPAVYYPYPRWYFPPRHAGFFFSFGPGINVGAFLGVGWRGWGYWGWRPMWENRTVVVNNTFIERHHFNTAGISNFRGTTVWSHEPYHRHGVPYPAPALTQRYRGNVRQNLGPRVEQQARVAPRPVPAPRAFARPAPAPRAAAPLPAPRGVRPVAPAFRPSEPMGNRQIPQNAPYRNRSVFGGIENGGAARAHINHGYSSLGPARAAVPHAAPFGGRSYGGGRSGGGRSGGGRSRGR